MRAFDRSGVIVIPNQWPFPVTGQEMASFSYGPLARRKYI
jgi:hypothetical protein